MSAKITPEEIKKINELYYECKSYAEVSRQTGRAASTIKKYVDPDWKPINERVEKNYTFNESMIINNGYHWNRNENLGRICVLTDKEKEELKEMFRNA